MSTNGCVSRKASSRGKSQPVAKVPTTPTLTTPRKWPFSNRSNVARRRLNDSACGNEGLSLVGQCQSARRAPEQLDAEARLQRLHLMADGCLTDAELHAGFGEAEMARGGLECAQGIERQIGLGHIQTLNFLMVNPTNDRLRGPDPLD